jgi:hypothetical protein
MARNSASRPLTAAPVRLASAVVLWVAVVAVTQGALCAELGEALRRVEDGIELRLRPPATLQQPPSRSSVPEPIEPWELVSV